MGKYFNHVDSFILLVSNYISCDLSLEVSYFSAVFICKVYSLCKFNFLIFPCNLSLFVCVVSFLEIAKRVQQQSGKAYKMNCIRYNVRSADLYDFRICFHFNHFESCEIF